MNEYHGFISRLSSELAPGSLIIDCHSFPSDLADIDICIGYNDDASKPEQEMIDKATHLFDRAGYKVGLNNPYSNSISIAWYWHKRISPCVKSGVSFTKSLWGVSGKALFAHSDDEEYVSRPFTSCCLSAFPW